jgi:23S rRNA-/tRNA-specific pseudouridylate synthase
MASIGFPLLGDLLYPELRREHAGADLPLQLLAERLSFKDPLDDGIRVFESERSLAALGKDFWSMIKSRSTKAEE